MSEVTIATTTVWDEDEIPRPDVSNLITEDDTPVDNQFSEKQMRLLTESIHASWQPEFPFVAMANVGVYVALNRPAIVPDVLVTTHVKPLQDLMDKEHKAYFSWIFDGKVPDVVVEIVSNTKGGELDNKLRNYQHMGVTWYAVFDPMHYLSDQTLTLFSLEGGKYRRQKSLIFESIGLGLILWEGEFEGVSCTWLRWCSKEGQLLATGQERALIEAQRAALEANRATSEANRATSEANRAAVLAAKLRELGVDPDTLL
jgi:Uma2 family endonuclease